VATPLLCIWAQRCHCKTLASAGSPSVLWKLMRYSISRSINDKNLHLVFEETCFDELPEHVRKQGPWQHLKSGEIEKLRPDYRQAISEHRYIIVEQSAAVFYAEK